MANEQAVQQTQDMATQPKKKASWFRTIMWMLGMIVAFNIIMGIIFYMVMK